MWNELNRILGVSRKDELSGAEPGGRESKNEAVGGEGAPGPQSPSEVARQPEPLEIRTTEPGQVPAAVSETQATADPPDVEGEWAALLQNEARLDVPVDGAAQRR